MWYIYTMEYYSAIKKNKIGSFLVMSMNLESVIQSKVKSEREKQISYGIDCMWNLKINGTDELSYKTEVESQM